MPDTAHKKEVEAYMDKRVTDLIETRIVPAVANSIEKHVNGKIEAFRRDQTLVNESQNKALQEIKESVRDIISVYDGSSKFFRTTKTAAGWITAISAAGLAAWAFVKFVVRASLLP